jgi:hypothetical protein
MFRAVATIVAITLAGAALGACGQSSTAPTPGRTPKGGQEKGATPTHGPLTTSSQAVVFANAVNIRPEDVPQFTVASSELQPKSGEQRLERALLECLGVMSGHDKLAAGNSKEFEYADPAGDFGVSSSVSVARTSAIAVRGLTPTRNRHEWSSCLSRSLSRVVEGKPKGGSNIRSLSATPEKAFAPGTSGGVVLRVLANIILAGKTVPLSLDFYGFVCGQAQIGLFTTSLPGSFPSKNRRQLLALLLARAKAHGQCARHSSNASTT